MDRQTTGGDECRPAREQNAGHDDDQQIERNEIAFLEAGGVNQRRDDDDVGGNLQSALPRWRAGSQRTKAMWKTPSVTQTSRRGRKERFGAGSGDVLRPDEVDNQDQENGEQADTGQPAQPFSRCRTLIHGSPAFLTPVFPRAFSSLDRNGEGLGVPSLPSANWILLAAPALRLVHCRSTCRSR